MEPRGLCGRDAAEVMEEEVTWDSALTHVLSGRGRYAVSIMLMFPASRCVTSCDARNPSRTLELPSCTNVVTMQSSPFATCCSGACSSTL
jgi:hypothetical protein